MSIRGYGTVMTFIVGAIFSFDAIWNLTNMEAIGAMFFALLIGIFAAIAFVFLTEPKQDQAKRNGSKPSFQTDNATGLSVMIQGRR